MAHPNHRLVKIHRTYTVDELARLFEIHRNTVREWIKRGLAKLDDKRPTLIHGRDLVSFLQARRRRCRRPCGIGEIYCVRCRTPRVPAWRTADYLPKSPTTGDLVGMCEVCGCLMYRRVNAEKLVVFQRMLDVRLPEGERHIDDSSHPSVNSDFAGCRQR
jgi:hypothetical protein